MTRWVLAALAAAWVVADARADSLWERRDPRYAFLFQDNRARSVGDVMTVVVSETTVTNEREQRNLNKGVTGNGTFTVNGETPLTLSDTFGRTFAGNAQMTTNRVFTDRLAVTVVDVLPNGNLVLEGFRSRVVAGEERVLRVTGVVRQADVGVGNVVQSQAIANLRISYLGRGPASRAINQNYLGRLLNRVLPW